MWNVKCEYVMGVEVGVMNEMFVEFKIGEEPCLHSHIILSKMDMVSRWILPFFHFESGSVSNMLTTRCTCILHQRKLLLVGGVKLKSGT